MMNLIRYQLYRLFRSYSTYFTMLAIMGLNVMLVSMNAAFAYEFPEHGTVSYFNTFIFDTGAFLMLFGLWSVVFTTGEISNGFIKQIVPLVNNKVKIFLSNLVVCGIMYLLTCVVTFIGTTIASFIFVDGIKLGSMVDYGVVVFTEFFLHLAVASIGMTITYLIKNFFASIAAVFAVVSGMTSIIFPGLEYILKQITGDKDLCICSWCISLSSTQVSYSVVDYKLPLTEIIVLPIILFVLYSVIAGITIIKRDVK